MLSTIYSNTYIHIHIHTYSKRQEMGEQLNGWRKKKKKPSFGRLVCSLKSVLYQCCGREFFLSLCLRKNCYLETKLDRGLRCLFVIYFLNMSDDLNVIIFLSKTYLAVRNSVQRRWSLLVTNDRSLVTDIPSTSAANLFDSKSSAWANTRELFVCEREKERKKERKRGGSIYQGWDNLFRGWAKNP